MSASVPIEMGPAANVPPAVADRARRALDEIPELAWQLDPHTMPPGDPDAPIIARTKVGTGPALVNLDVAALTDPRTTWDGEPGSPRYWRAALTDWDNRAADRLGLDRKPGTLAAWWDILAGEAGAGMFEEITAEILGLHGQLKAAAGVPRRRDGALADVGPCVCGGRLLVAGDLIPRCGACGRSIVSLSIGEAAARLGLTEAAVRKAIQRGKATAAGRNRVDVPSLIRWRNTR